MRTAPYAPIMALALLACSGTAPAAVVINEVDYDQPGTDTAEFIELFNTGTNGVNLADYALSLINGTTGSSYLTIALNNVDIAAGAYYVVCGNAASVVNCDQEASRASNLIQNGAPDGVALLTAGIVTDALSYEGDVGGPYAEDGGSSLADSNTQDYVGLSRIGNGVDTGSNSADFALSCISPGAANTNTASDCSAPAVATVPEPAGSWLLSVGLGALVLMQIGLRRLALGKPGCR